MTPQEKQQLKGLFLATAMYYGQEIPDQALILFVRDLEDLPYAAVNQALIELRREPKTIRRPLPAIIRQRVDLKTGNKNTPELIASEIIEAISNVGPYQTPTLGHHAKEIISREGGWQQVCEMVTNDNLTIFRAQWRDMARALIETGFTPRENVAQISHDTNQVRQMFGSVMKLMPTPEKENV